jgi:hypothetical protein
MVNYQSRKLALKMELAALEAAQSAHQSAVSAKAEYMARPTKDNESRFNDAIDWHLATRAAYLAVQV